MLNCIISPSWEAIFYRRQQLNNETIEMHQLKICTFKGIQNLPLYVAIQQNFFAQQALHVEIIYTTGSIPQLVGLIREEYQLIQTAPDNVINVDNNPIVFGLDPATTPHVIMLLGGSVGTLSIFAQRDITTFDRLRGAVLGVDNPTSGFAIVLRDILARNELLLERDYTFTVAGGTSDRLDALKKGAVAATILYAPYDVLASQAGFNKLATSTDYYSAYASLATAGIQSWIEQHSDEVTSYIIAYLKALRWIYDPAHVQDVQAIMQNEPALGLDASLAPHVYTAFVDPKSGFGQNAQLDDIGLQQVIDLRASYALSSPIERDLAYYRDLRRHPKEGNI
jgi:ABC-type nitrate/sulfonate/bicarbonate transport system substrate-binding protein